MHFCQTLLDPPLIEVLIEFKVNKLFDLERPLFVFQTILNHKRDIKFVEVLYTTRSVLI